jgi:effector-binding domain-containing protein
MLGRDYTGGFCRHNSTGPSKQKKLRARAEFYFCGLSIRAGAERPMGRRTIMIDAPQIVSSAARQVACIHLTVPREQIRDVMGPGIKEVMATIAAQRLKPAGPWFTHHLKMDPKMFDFRICVPVPTPVQPAGRVKPGELAARSKVARTIYRGPYEGLAGAWGEFEKWIAANGHKSAADLWEIYAVGPESGSDASKWHTELNRPLMD